MTTYVPFLKFKGGEINAIGSLDADVSAHLCPFFDFPMRGGLDTDQFEVITARTVRALQKHAPDLTEFYFDTYDVPDELQVDGEQCYGHLLTALSEHPVIPVLALNRDASRIAIVRTLKENGTIRSPHLALRLSAEDFESFGAVINEIAAFAPIFELFEDVDLVFDFRVCHGVDPVKAAKTVLSFSQKFCLIYPVRRVIVTGSSIPSTIGSLLKTRSDVVFDRAELKIFHEVAPKHTHAPLVFGDYATVSPDYVDPTLPPEILQSFMTPRLIYTIKGRHFIIRGGRIKGAYHQYFTMAKTLCSNGFFRGRGFSTGDEYLDDKGRGLGNNGTPAAVVKPTVNAHLTYMVSVLPF